MRALVIYYTRSGTTKKAVGELTKHIRADMYELVDHKKRSGLLGWLRSGRDAAKKKLTGIDKPTNVPSRYPVVILATPNWVGSIPPAMRMYIKEYLTGVKKLAFIVTQGGKGQEKILTELEELTGQKPVAAVQLRSKDVKKQTEAFKTSLKGFVEKLAK
ncbi:MAG: flavodoxin family protein [Nanobdellota archaeon]